MDRALPDALVTGYEHLIASLTLPDENDRHVLAAAIKAEAGIIVTSNLNDFPPGVLQAFDIEAQHPDEFILNLLMQEPRLVLEAAHNHRVSLKDPPKTIEEYLTSLHKHGLTKTASGLRKLIETQSPTA